FGTRRQRQMCIRDRGAREKREALAQRAAEETRVRDEGIAAFRGLDPNAPLRDWLPYTSDSIEEIREGAVAAIRSRPRLDEDLAEILRSAEPLPALRYISQWYRNPPASLAGPVSDAISSLPDWVRRRLDDSDDSNNYEIGNACDACLAIVDDFHDPRLDFRPGIERLVAYLDSRALPPERISYDSTHLARSTLHAWLDAHRGAGAKNAADDAARPAGRATDRQ
ncbi:MAG: hypothetical protein QUU85_09680, partial [Candidatus Eisenbacteria bacterium]|nr:hypothetical protein [Candidatus Eisenbacteria bacterium]